MNELSLYDKDGLFHNIVKKSTILAGRYAILPKKGVDLNVNNTLSGLNFPEGKYPGVFCLPPISGMPASLQMGTWECFYIRMFFLTTAKSTGDNKIKTPDPNTNTSLHTTTQDWHDMKVVALGFMNALEKMQVKMRGAFRLKQRDEWKIFRLVEIHNDRLNGVMIMFECEIAAPCVFTDIAVNEIEIPNVIHEPHFH